MTYTKIRVVTLAVLLAGAVRCNNNGTETDNPLRTFEGSTCHKDGTPEDAAPPTGSADHGDGVGTKSERLEIAGDYTRLACVAWDRSSSRLRVSLKNFRSGCGIEWAGAAVKVSGNKIRLEPVNPGCLVAHCGNCFYDLDFDLDAGAAGSAGADLDVEVFVTDESGKYCDSYSTGGPDEALKVAAAEPSGERCRPIPPTYFLPPPDECQTYTACDSGCACPAGQRCVSGDSSSTCNPECTTADDCPVPGAFECTDGLCAPKPWP